MAARLELRPAPSIELVAPAALNVGDRVELEVRVRWPDARRGELGRVAVECVADGRLEAQAARQLSATDPRIERSADAAGPFT